MKNILTSKDAKIVIERDENGMGICYFEEAGPKSTECRGFQEAYDLLEGLVDYLMEGTLGGREEKVESSVYVKTAPLPPDTSFWILTETPYIWKGRVIVSQDSYDYYESLRHELISKAGKEKSELLQIVLFKRAACCKDITNEVLKNLG